MLYYSEILNKKFVTEQELKDAEAKYAQEKADKDLALKIKKEKAKQVEDALTHLLEVKKEASKTVKVAEDAYLKVRDEFVKQYGSWHYTITDENDDSYIVSESWGSWGKILSEIFNNF